MILETLLRKITDFLDSEPEEDRTGEIISADNEKIDFLEKGGLVSIPKNKIKSSQLAQNYAIEGTIVTDIRERKENKYFSGSHKEFDINLSWGVTYSIIRH